MSYPMTDAISGRPASAAPAIQTTARTNHRNALRAKCAIIVPVGQEPPEYSHLFVSGHALRRTLLEPGEMVDVYRSRRRPADIPQSPYYRVIEQPTRELPVSAAEIQELYRLSQHQERLARLLEIESPEWIVRRERGDLATLGWWDSPYSLTRDDAAARGTESLTTAELYCGVRPSLKRPPGEGERSKAEPVAPLSEVGRWEAYRGLGRYLVVEAITDSREEAEALATAALWAAWLKRVREIQERRLGDLSWGEPVGCPVSLPLHKIGDPQAKYAAELPVF